METLRRDSGEIEVPLEMMAEWFQGTRHCQEALLNGLNRLTTTMNENKQMFKQMGKSLVAMHDEQRRMFQNLESLIQVTVLQRSGKSTDGFSSSTGSTGVITHRQRRRLNLEATILNTSCNS